MPKPPRETLDEAYRQALGHYERVIATVPELERKGAANPYTAVNGHMTSYLHPRGAMALRLSPAVRQAFLAQFNASLFEAYGLVQKDYVTVPALLLADTVALAPFVRASHDYVAALKPKAPTKGRSKTSD